MNMHVPREAQLRVATLLDVVLDRAHSDRCIFRAGRAEMDRRWAALESAFASSADGGGDLRLAPRPDGDAPAWAALTCSRRLARFSATPEDREELRARFAPANLGGEAEAEARRGCGGYLLFRAGILAHHAGDVAGLGEDAAALDLTMRDADFDVLLRRLRELLARLAPPADRSS